MWAKSFIALCASIYFLLCKMEIITVPTSLIIRRNKWVNVWKLCGKAPGAGEARRTWLALPFFPVTITVVVLSFCSRFMEVFSYWSHQRVFSFSFLFCLLWKHCKAWFFSLWVVGIVSCSVLSTALVCVFVACLFIHSGVRTLSEPGLAQRLYLAALGPARHPLAVVGSLLSFTQAAVNFLWPEGAR